ncbi:MAG TPA: DUF4238 domain-containing protein [Tepidisphaeraceae bacterium]|nr:DUF4238 domain-containing protein [Tepidisphaeraceae bacterium]
MSAKHHYVSQFHLRHFVDPNSTSKKDPWLWQGWIPDGPVKRCAPKNMGWKRGMFDGPGALLDRDATLESFLSNEVEGPAATAMRALSLRLPGTGGELPIALTRYLAWAAARSLPMQTLGNFWGEKGFGRNGAVAEPPPKGLLNAVRLPRDVAMRHPTLGRRVFPPGSEMDQAIIDGWHPDMSERANFLEGVHIQAYYFQARFFPRFKWFALHAPKGEFFVIADRAVGWAADGYIDAPPSCLRDPSAYVLAPITKSLVLVGRHKTNAWHVAPSQVNAVVASWAHEWIAGPTRDTVEAALDARRRAFKGD